MQTRLTVLVTLVAPLLAGCGGLCEATDSCDCADDDASLFSAFVFVEVINDLNDPGIFSVGIRLAGSSFGLMSEPAFPINDQEIDPGNSGTASFLALEPWLKTTFYRETGPGSWATSSEFDPDLLHDGAEATLTYRTSVDPVSGSIAVDRQLEIVP